MLKNWKTRVYSWLKWSEKYLKVDMVYLAKGGFWSGSAFVVSALINFVITLVFANFLPKESYGLYKYIFSVYGILGAFAFSNLGILIIQAVASGNEGVLKRAFFYSLKWNIPFAVISFGVSVYYFINANLGLSTAFLFIGILAPLSTSFGVFSSFLNGKKDFRLLSISNVVGNITSAAVTFLTIVYTQNPIYIALGYFFTNTFVSIFFYRYTLNKYHPNSEFEEGSLDMGKHFSVMNIFTIIAQNIDKVLIFHFLGGSSLAIYSFAQAPVNQMASLLKLSGPIYTPKILEKTKEENKRELPKKFFQLFFVMIIPVTAYILLAPYFYKIFFPQYIEAIIYSQFYVLTLLTFGKKFIGIPMPVYFSKKVQYQMSIINPVLDLVPKLILLYFFGLAGAIAAAIVSNILISAVSFYFFKRFL